MVTEQRLDDLQTLVDQIVTVGVGWSSEKYDEPHEKCADRESKSEQKHDHHRFIRRAVDERCGRGLRIRDVRVLKDPVNRLG